MLRKELEHQTLLRALREQLIPRAEKEGVEKLFLGEAPFVPPRGVTALKTGLRTPRKMASRRSYIHHQRWSEEGLESLRFVQFGAVLEGEADLRIGNGVFSFPEGTMMLVPPGVPQPDGSRPHWERSCPEQASSRLFWFLTMPSGIFCHICTTHNNAHHSAQHLFLCDPQLHLSTENLLHELRERECNHDHLARLSLLSILYRAERELASGRFITNVRQMPFSDPASGLSPFVERACAYIHRHLAQPLTLTDIASNAHVSVSHLNRRFRAEVGTTIIQYVTDQRVESAKSLLENTDLPIHQVARVTGFADRSYFTKVFTKQVKTSPTDYRSRQTTRKPRQRTH